jgi:hypothetical protein
MPDKVEEQLEERYDAILRIVSPLTQYKELLYDNQQKK